MISEVDRWSPIIRAVNDPRVIVRLLQAVLRFTDQKVVPKCCLRSCTERTRALPRGHVRCRAAAVTEEVWIPAQPMSRSIWKYDIPSFMALNFSKLTRQGGAPLVFAIACV